MDYYIKIILILIPFVLLCWRFYKTVKYTIKLERSFLNLISLLEKSNNKQRDKVLEYIKNTEIYQEALKNNLN